MTKSVVALAAAAALVSGVAFAQEVKQVQKPVVAAPAQAAPAQMTDAEMDKVTAGYDVVNSGRGEVFDSRVNGNGACNGFRGQSGNAAYTTPGC